MRSHFGHSAATLEADSLAGHHLQYYAVKFEYLYRAEPSVFVVPRKPTYAED